MKESFSAIPVQETLQQSSFDEQFSAEHTLSVHGEPIHFVDLMPAELKFQMPLFVAPGWAETPATFKDSLQVFFDSGRRTLSVEHGRLVPRLSDEDSESEAYFSALSPSEKTALAEYHFEDSSAEGVPMPELLKARAILAVLEKQGIEKTDVLAHSEGAINTLIAAALSPEKFRNIVLLGAAGLTGKGTDNAFVRIVSGIRTSLQDLPFLKNKKSRDGVMRANRESLAYIAKSPIAALEEVGAIAGFHIGSMLAKLREKGIHISIVHGEDETMFPVDEMRVIAEKAKADGSIDEFYSLKGNYHHSIYMEDEARFIEGVLASIEEKR